MQPQHAIVPDFRKQPYGCLVVYSPHWHKQNAGFKPEGTPKRGPRYGIVTELSFYEDADGRAIPWPWVHWEGELSNSLCHPLNVIPFRDKEFANMTMNLEMKEIQKEEPSTDNALQTHLL